MKTRISTLIYFNTSMGSQTTLELPVIDLTEVNLDRNSSQWISSCNEVQKALVDYGCFVAKYDEVPADLHHQMLGAMKELFDSSTNEVKVQNSWKDPFFYFCREDLSRSTVEGFQLRKAATPEGVTNLKSFVQTVWPHGNEAFCDTFLSYGTKIAKLDQIVANMVMESYGVGKYSESYVESMTYAMLVLRYRAIPNSTLGCQAHSDNSFISILDTNHVKGLEIQTKDEMLWLDYKPIPGHLIVMAGDALFGWSNGRIHSPTHRVIYSGDEDRYTIKLNSYVRELVEVPNELIDDEHPLLFSPFSNLEYCEFSRKRCGDRHDLISYCGV